MSIRSFKLSNINISYFIVTRLVPSLYKEKYRFNGFMFGVNMRAIQAVAFNHPTELFDSSTINVGQEDLLAKELEKHRLLPKVSSKAFCYHYKSITVKVSDEVKTLHKKQKTNNKDLRDNLQYFHSETSRKNGKGSVSYNSRVHKFIQTQSNMWTKHYNSVQIYPSQTAPITTGSPVIRYDSVRSIDATLLPELQPSNRDASSIVVAFATSGTTIAY